ncbi:MAG TPA: hypothetical protein VER32_09465 [Pyrinomonadaceae bacterium]|nr:hypothetical protein [Pyrinomonadaceae bacterium]
MWDTKRQLIWLAGGLLFGTFFIYQNARDEDGRLGLKYFIVLETLLLVIMAVMFFVYGRKQQ